jgi:hypothetical protein
MERLVVGVHSVGLLHGILGHVANCFAWLLCLKSVVRVPRQPYGFITEL